MPTRRQRSCPAGRSMGGFGGCAADSTLAFRSMRQTRRTGRKIRLLSAEVWPCYFTGWTAANAWALSDQVFRTTVLKTTARVRAASVRLLDHDYLITSVSEQDMEWGMKSQWRSESRLRFADPASWSVSR
jgi:hypothetical protein